MKKILSVLFVSLLLMGLPAAVSADEDEEVSGNSATVTLIAAKASTYTVKLPRTVDVSANSQTFDVYAKGDIWADKQLEVSVSSGNHKLSDTAANGKADVPLTITVANGTFSSTVLETVYTAHKATFTVTHSDLLAGNYSYNLPLTIALNDVSA